MCPWCALIKVMNHSLQSHLNGWVTTVIESERAVEAPPETNEMMEVPTFQVIHEWLLNPSKKVQNESMNCYHRLKSFIFVTLTGQLKLTKLSIGNLFPHCILSSLHSRIFNEENAIVILL